jgi:dephospho-CoA kinase
MKLRIGLTGGIGSGKSVIARIFRILGIPVYDADLAARRLMETDETLIKDIQKVFGAEIYSEGKLNRKLLASQVFKDESKLDTLNKLVHPAVLKDYNEWEQKQKAPYSIREAAILFESGNWQQLDHVILVDAPEDLRIRRVIQRDNRSEKEVREIISRQWTSEKKKELAWRLIRNDDSELVIPQVLQIHNQLLNA